MSEQVTKVEVCTVRCSESKNFLLFYSQDNRIKHLCAFYLFTENNSLKRKNSKIY